MRTLQGPSGAVGGSSASATPASGYVPLQAGMALAAKDLLTIDEDGLAYKATDAAFLVNPNKLQIYTALTTTQANAATGTYVKSPLILANGNFVVHAEDPTNTRHDISLWGRDGALIRQVTHSFGGNSPSFAGLALLSDGNFVLGFVHAGGQAGFIIYDPDLNVVAGPTNIEGASNGANTSTNLLALAGGGFVFGWSLATNPSHIRWAIYSNSGAPVLAANTLVVVTGTENSETRFAQFANGNILVFARQSKAGAALQRAVFTSAGVVVAAMANWAPAAGEELIPRGISVLGNIACAVFGGTSTTKAALIDSAGAGVGATYSLSGMLPYCMFVSNDGTDFQVLTISGSGAVANLIRITTAGVARRTTRNKGVTGMGSAGRAIFVDNEWLCVNGTTTPSIVANRVLLTGEVVSVGVLSAQTVQQIGIPAIIAPGVAVFQFGNAANVDAFQITRYRGCAIRGVAAAAAVKGATVQAASAVGAYEINPILCASPVNFNHKATNVTGHQGTLLPRSVSLLGVV